MHKSKHGQEDLILMDGDGTTSSNSQAYLLKDATQVYYSGRDATGQDRTISHRNSSGASPRVIDRVPTQEMTPGKDLTRIPVGPAEVTPIINNTKAGNEEETDVAYNKYANVKEVEPIWYVQMKMVIPILVILSIVILLAWWWYDTYLLKRKNVTPTPDFSAMLQTFYSYSDDFWFNRDISVFKENLADSKYHIIIADSNLQVIYDNRNSYTWIYPNYEIIKSISDDKPTLVSLNGVRTLAATVHKGSSVRIIHIEYIG